MKKLITISALSCSTLLLNGCAHDLYHMSSNNIAKTHTQLQHLNITAKKAEPAVKMIHGYYYDTTPHAPTRAAAWTAEPIQIHASNMPFSEVLHKILANRAVSVRLDHSLNAKQNIDIHYKGSIAGAIVALAHIADYDFHWVNDHEMDWSAWQTKTFNIAFMPGSSHYLVGQQTNENTSSKNTQSSQSPISQINDEQYSNLSGKLSIWNDLRKTLERMKSKTGRVSISEATTSVTITDQPSRVRAMQRFIQTLNKKLSKEVSIRVQVLEVRLNKDFNFGINWNIVAHALDSKFNLLGNLADASNLAPSSLVVSTATKQPRLVIGKTSQSLVNALNEQGQVRVVTEPQVITMNNQMASIRITKNVSYIQSVIQTQNLNLNAAATSSVTPGTVTDGFTLYLLPKISGNKVYLQITSTIATLDALDKVSTQPDGTANNNGSFQAIQLPTVSQKAFNQRSVIDSGSTLIMAGYKRLEDQTKAAKMFGIDPLGGHGARRQNIETLILITPVILDKASSHVSSIH